MPRAEYYEVGEDAYLYPAIAKNSGSREQPEELVRQWCAFELIRTYGVSINDIEFEREVKVGSKTYRVDIIVSRRGQLSVVVECKPRGHKKHGEAMSQAISYADAQTIRADFAVYTNGDEWRVQRRVGDRWVAVTDIPRDVSRIGTEPITEIFRACKDVAPLLYKLDETLAGDDARHFLDAMWMFFAGANMLNEDVDRDLLFATDNLLRVLSGAHEHPNYRFGKFDTARHHFELYRQKTGCGDEIGPMTGRDPLRVEKQYLHVALSHMVEHSDGLGSVDVLVLRLNVALLEYGRQQESGKQNYPQVGTSLHHVLREYLQYALAVHFNASLPDTLDHILVGYVKNYCRGSWEALEAEEKVSFKQFVSIWFAWLRHICRFRRD